MFKCSSCLFAARITRPLSTWSLSQLKTKSIIQLDGKDNVNYLQGLLTNDLQHLSAGNNCIFSFMLNHLGRIVADLFIYNYGDSSLLIETDTRVASTVYKQLLIYKLRRDVSVKKRDDLKVWTVHPSSQVDCHHERRIKSFCNSSMVATNDPRVPSIPIYRAVTDKHLIWNDLEEIVNLNFTSDETLTAVDETDESAYIEFRYRNGISEGASDHLTGSSFPLESNGDYQNAISFLKGCYVGQELTARTYHTGVTRKRLMPISLHQSHCNLVQGTELLSGDGKRSIGKVRGVQGSVGLALIYMERAMKHGWKMYPASEHGIEVVAIKPFWWPQ